MAGMAIDRKKSLKPYGIRDSCTSWSIQFMIIAFYSVKNRHGKTRLLMKNVQGRGKNEEDFVFMTFSSIIAHF